MMKIFSGWAAALAIGSAGLASPLLAASPIDGAWKADLKSADFSKKPDTLLLKDGVYSCTTCVPVFTVKADGEFHKLTGIPYVDEASIKVIDGDTIEETDKLKGKIVSTAKSVLSSGGAMLAIHWTDSSAPDGKMISGDVMQLRVAPAPMGAHAISGGWLAKDVANVPDAALTVHYLLAGDMLTMTTPQGYHFTAKLGGPAVPIVGDTAGTMASVVRLPDGSYEESDSRDGKVVLVIKTMIAPDGKSMDVTNVNKLKDTTMSFKAFKL